MVFCLFSRFSGLYFFWKAEWQAEITDLHAAYSVCSGCSNQGVVSSWDPWTQTGSPVGCRGPKYFEYLVLHFPGGLAGSRIKSRALGTPLGSLIWNTSILSPDLLSYNNDPALGILWPFGCEHVDRGSLALNVFCNTAFQINTSVSF